MGFVLSTGRKILHFLRTICIGIISQSMVTLMIVLMLMYHFSLEGFVRDTASDIYDYSNPELRTEMNSAIDRFCGILIEKTGEELLAEGSMGELKERVLAQGEDAAEVEQTFKVINDCHDYSTQQIAEKAFLGNILVSSLNSASQQYRSQEDHPLQPYFRLTANLQFKVLGVLGFFAALLFLFYITTPFDYLKRLSKIIIVTGIFLLVMYAAATFAGTYGEIDTTPILTFMLKGALGSALEQTDQTPEWLKHDSSALASALALVVLPKLFSRQVFVTGALLVMVGFLAFEVLKRASSSAVKVSGTKNIQNKK